jgi:hypothetical protein
VCEKPRIKCSDCPNQRFLPVNDEVVRWHLSGRDGEGRDMGVYPMDHDFRPYPDQWAFLASIQRVARPKLDALVEAAEGRGRIIGVRMAATEAEDDAPWTEPPSRRRKEAPIADPLPTDPRRCSPMRRGCYRPARLLGKR